MRKTWAAAIAAAMMIPAAAFTVGSAGATNIGNEGCTPGYWKNHTDNWFEDVGVPIPTTKTLGGAGFHTVNVPKSTTLLAALSLKGGNGLAGAEQILMRAAAAAYLNAAHEGLGYPIRRAVFVPQVNAAIASGSRDAMINYAAYLDGLNNLGCPLN